MLICRQQSFVLYFSSGISKNKTTTKKEEKNPHTLIGKRQFKLFLDFFQLFHPYYLQIVSTQLFYFCSAT